MQGLWRTLSIIYLASSPPIIYTLRSLYGLNVIRNIEIHLKTCGGWLTAIMFMNKTTQHAIAFLIGMLFTGLVVYIALRHGFDGSIGNEPAQADEVLVAEPDAYSEAENDPHSISLNEIIMYKALGANPEGYRDAYGNFLCFSGDGHYLFHFRKMTQDGELRYIKHYEVEVLESVIQTDILTFPNMGVVNMEWPLQVQDNGTTWYLFELTQEFYDDVEEAL